MSFDEQPDGDIHGECAFEIHRLEARVRELEEENARLKSSIDELKSRDKRNDTE